MWQKLEFKLVKTFGKLVKPLLSNKRFVENAEIMLAVKDKIVTNKKEFVRISNDLYVNIAEDSRRTKPTNAPKEQ